MSYSSLNNLQLQIKCIASVTLKINQRWRFHLYWQHQDYLAIADFESSEHNKPATEKMQIQPIPVWSTPATFGAPVHCVSDTWFKYTPLAWIVSPGASASAAYKHVLFHSQGAVTPLSWSSLLLDYEFAILSLLSRKISGHLSDHISENLFYQIWRNVKNSSRQW